MVLGSVSLIGVLGLGVRDESWMSIEGRFGGVIRISLGDLSWLDTMVRSTNLFGVSSWRARNVNRKT